MGEKKTNKKHVLIGAIVFFLVILILFVVIKKQADVYREKKAIEKTEKEELEKSKEKELKIEEEIKKKEAREEEVGGYLSPPKEMFIEIENKKEFVTPVMNAWQYLLHDSIAYFVEEEELDVTKATCLNCAVSIYAPENTDFYLELNDKDKTLIVATYSPKEKVVAVDYTEYTKQEILDEVWVNDGAPPIRDIEE